MNGERIYTPYRLDDGTTIEQSGMYVAVRTQFGIDIYYDGDGNAEVKASCEWFGKLCGLLGMDFDYEILSCKSSSSTILVILTDLPTVF